MKFFSQQIGSNSEIHHSFPTFNNVMEAHIQNEPNTSTSANSSTIFHKTQDMEHSLPPQALQKLQSFTEVTQHTWECWENMWRSAGVKVPLERSKSPKGHQSVAARTNSKRCPTHSMFIPFPAISLSCP